MRTFNAGRISGSGNGLSTVYNTLPGAQKAHKLKVSLSAAGRRNRPHSVKVRVGFLAKNRSLPSSSAFVTVHF